MTAPLIRNLDALDGTQTALAGGKGASLGELVLAGARVPPGFAITRPAFDAFMVDADPEGRIAGFLSEVDSEQADVAKTAQAIADLLGGAPVPEAVVSATMAAWNELGVPRVSVRSSATCEDGSASAWAGQLDTFLNVGVDDLLSQVKACWLSIFRAPALAYGAAHGYGAGEFGVAVVVQEMVPSEVSGIGFSVHPVTQEPDLRLIEACFGQGEAIVSGEIDPDQFVVERGAKRIVESTRGEQKKGLFLEADAAKPVWRDLGERGREPKLSEDQVLEYAGLLDGIEAHYGHPVDTEWAYANGAFHLLQARPITTLAAEYREQMIDMSEPWSALQRRPLMLLEASTIAHWLDAAHSDEIGFTLDRHLSIQDSPGMTQMFTAKRVVDAVFEHFPSLERTDRPHLLEQLKRARAIYDEGRKRLDEREPFRNLEEASEFFIEIGKYTTGFPNFMLLALEAAHIDDPEVRELAEWLRARSLYPEFAHGVLVPMVQDMTRELGFSEPERAAEVATWREARQGTLDCDTLEERLEKVRSGHLYVLQVIGDSEKLWFLSETGYLVMRLRGNRKIVSEDPNVIAGQAAWPGVHRGRARVILSAVPTGYAVEDGDVIVSPQSNPTLMPLLRHAGAIVTDDGGIACHAAIISRELKIPTLIGTRRATSTIQDGDLIEVDATEQVVRIIEHAPPAEI